mmetsp:Transcript_5280/g.11980  ORF Transcript_5280/g.11980 Transcript_5280/m.11980 type:complete len:230 (-) Transcript_5280:231-920(-)
MVVVSQQKRYPDPREKQRTGKEWRCFPDVGIIGKGRLVLSRSTTTSRTGTSTVSSSRSRAVPKILRLSARAPVGFGIPRSVVQQTRIPRKIIRDGSVQSKAIFAGKVAVPFVYAHREVGLAVVSPRRHALDALFLVGIGNAFCYGRCCCSRSVGAAMVHVSGPCVKGGFGGCARVCTGFRYPTATVCFLRVFVCCANTGSIAVVVVVVVVLLLLLPDLLLGLFPLLERY